MSPTMTGPTGPTDLSHVDPRPEFVLTDGEKQAARRLVLNTCPGDPADVLAMLGVAA
ncbi:hypothetical protein [Curtobacterium poinsettiae]|uniref:hypothetical protein n=1 Tax=Curtobacterium poinsettiae TaxID=159612 RepID=UPI00217EF817|nr:hypothetical protein [Curtobacterium flaccumfaciens]MCS6578224.1 hypothetical protein [Curtobacterium flaccumfaciens]